MLGIAQKLFLEQTEFQSRKLKAPFFKNCNPRNWPSLQVLLNYGYLSYIDFILAKKLLQDFPEVGEEVAAFICYLSYTSRQGHLCIKIDKQDILPSIADTLIRNSKENILADISHEILQGFSRMVLDGSKVIPPALLTTCSNIISPVVPKTPICQFTNHFYLQRNWLYETLFLNNYLTFEKTSPKISLNEEEINRLVSSMESHKQLLHEQASAIKNIKFEGLTIICGGPGTGKTYTAGMIVKTLWQSLTIEQKIHYQIALAAPTGKAASNLQNSLKSAISHLEGFQSIKAQTLHGLLGIKGKTNPHSHSPLKLSADLLIIDECSMIDVKMMSTLFNALKPGSRLILLGDPNQLPPVEAGSLFSDLIIHRQNLQQSSKQPTKLKTCLRAELKEIVYFAELINLQDASQAIQTLSNTANSTGIQRRHISSNSPQEIQKLLLEYAEDLFPSPSMQLQDIQLHEYLNLFNQFRILSPMRKGYFGVDEINLLFFKHLLKAKHLPCRPFISPIMLVNNAPQLELFNGEVGILVQHNLSQKQESNVSQQSDFAIFPDNTHGSHTRRIPALLLPKYEYAYCLSVHKSQGSEFDHVLLLMPDGSQLFGKEILYTAVTRARKKIEIWGDDQIFTETISHSSYRLSGISSRIGSV